MNSNEINEILRAFEDFQVHSTEPANAPKSDFITEFPNWVEQKAAELEVTCDYYIQEFM